MFCINVPNLLCLVFHCRSCICFFSEAPPSFCLMIKQLIKKIFRYLPFGITKNQRYDIQTQKIIRKVCRPDSNCIDVGCHKGEIMDLMRKFAPRGRHYGFEPIPHMYQNLVTKYAGTSCIISPVALSNETGTATFNFVVSNPSYSGLLKRRYDRPHEQDTTIEVSTAKLDDVLPEDYRADLIKIDVEGAERLVLEGARQTLLRYHPVVIFEHGLGASDVYGTTPVQLFEFFETCGYQIFLLHNWLRQQAPLSLQEFREQFQHGLNYYFVASPIASLQLTTGQ